MTHVTRSRTAALLATFLLAFPAAAAAQSAGDEQYSDPFAEPPPSEQTDTPGTPDSSQPPTGTSTDTAQTVVQEQPVEDATGATLPRSGLPLGGLAAGGALLLACGITMRRRLATSGG